MRKSSHGLDSGGPGSFAYCLELSFAPSQEARNIVSPLKQSPEFFDQVLGGATLGCHFLNTETAVAAQLEQHRPYAVTSFDCIFVRRIVEEHNAYPMAIAFGLAAKIDAAPVAPPAQKIIVVANAVEQLIERRKVNFFQLIQTDSLLRHFERIALGACQESV